MLSFLFFAFNALSKDLLSIAYENPIGHDKSIDINYKKQEKKYSSTKILKDDDSPSIQFIEMPKQEYHKNTRIHVEGIIKHNQDNSFDIVYKFDDGGLHKINRENSGEFKDDISFPDGFEIKNHSITFKLAKNWTPISQDYVFNFSFIQTHRAEIQNLRPSLNEVALGSSITVKGQIRDQDINSYSNITLSFGTIELTIDNFATTDDWRDFEFNLTIPLDTNPGENIISVSAKDSGFEESTTIECTITVVLPMTPLQTASQSSKAAPQAIGEQESSSQKSEQSVETVNPSAANINGGTIPPKGIENLLIIVIGSIITVIIIAILIAVFIYKRTHRVDTEEESSIEMAETIVQSIANDTVTLDNPLFTTTTADEDHDIFAGDFEEGETVHYFFIKEEDA